MFLFYSCIINVYCRTLISYSKYINLLLLNEGGNRMLKIEEIRELIKVIDESSINELTFEVNDTKLSLKKKTDEQQVVTQQIVETAIPQIHEGQRQQVQTQTDSQTKPIEESTQTDTVDYDYEITSPMVGTLYSSPTPDSEAYVSVGTKVTKDTVVCIVEAMKLFNEIEAEVSGEIVEILVENGELVEYGQPLFRVKK